ncbi:hypothetical protein PUN28_006968 [Cardiocondyla obscurior]|uniref:Uncharacterized protein n=1 Tax=Cardiocondyla obscurior TaxID=286306 RepID=A0AAW2G6Q5_9HYME
MSESMLPYDETASHLFTFLFDFEKSMGRILLCFAMGVSTPVTSARRNPDEWARLGLKWRSDEPSHLLILLYSPLLRPLPSTSTSFFISVTYVSCLRGRARKFISTMLSMDRYTVLIYLSVSWS